MRRAGRRLAQRLRESRVVHLLHPLPGRNIAGPPRGAAELPDRGHLAHGHGDRQLFAAGRRHGRGRGDADDVLAAFARSRQGGPQPALRGPQPLPADARRAAHAQRAVRHRADRGRLRRIRIHGPGVRRRRAVSGRRRRRARLRRLHRRGARPRRARHGRLRPAGAGAAEGAGRVGGRHRRRHGAAARNADGLRRPGGGLHDHARSLQAQHAGTHHRRLGGPAGQPRTAHGAPDARAAHQARTRHVEHLHRFGADGLDDGFLLRLQRSRRIAARRTHGAPRRRDDSPRAGGDGLPPRVGDVLRHARGGGRGRRRAVAGPRRRHQLLLPLGGYGPPVVRRGDHPRRGRDRHRHLPRREGPQGEGQ